jgi:hypothetical protein
MIGFPQKIWEGDELRNSGSFVNVLIFAAFVGLAGAICGCSRSSEQAPEQAVPATGTTDGNAEVSVTTTDATPEVRAAVAKALQGYILTAKEGEKSLEETIEDIKSLTVEMPDGTSRKLGEIEGVRVEVKHTD